MGLGQPPQQRVQLQVQGQSLSGVLSGEPQIYLHRQVHHHNYNLYNLIFAEGAISRWTFVWTTLSTSLTLPVQVRF